MVAVTTSELATIPEISLKAQSTDTPNDLRVDLEDYDRSDVLTY